MPTTARRPLAAGRVPWEPLGRYLRLRSDMPVHENGNSHAEGFWHTGVAARMLGVDPRQINRWKANGLSARTADRVATHLNTHAYLLWGEDWEIAAMPSAKRRRLASTGAVPE